MTVSTNSTQALLNELFDYAGLFPPAGLPMPQAVVNYAAYLLGEHTSALGRFIVPVGRLDEFERCLPNVADGAPWFVSALVGGDLEANLQHIAAFNKRHAADVVIDTVELKTNSPEAIGEFAGLLPKKLTTYFEIPLGETMPNYLAAIARTDARAKIRTGGVTPDMFPDVAALAQFLESCAETEVEFKATSGLHHAIRGVYPLTYEPHSATTTMHGFLNVLLAAAFAHTGMTADVLGPLLEETSPRAFRFAEDGVTWRGNRLSMEQLTSARERFVIAFGSCSFEEPIAALKSFSLL